MTPAVGPAGRSLTTDPATPPLIVAAVAKLRVFADEHDDDEIAALIDWVEQAWRERGAS